MCYSIVPFVLGTVCALFTMWAYRHYMTLMTKYARYEDSWKWAELTIRSRDTFQVFLIITCVLFLLGITAWINWMWG